MTWAGANSLQCRLSSTRYQAITTLCSSNRISNVSSSTCNNAWMPRAMLTVSQPINWCEICRGRAGSCPVLLLLCQEGGENDAARAFWCSKGTGHAIPLRRAFRHGAWHFIYRRGSQVPVLQDDCRIVALQKPGRGRAENIIAIAY